MACCGSTCSIDNAEFSSSEGTSFTISLSANEIDIRSFGTGTFGDYLACNEQGTISITSYIRPVVDINDSITFTGTICSESISVACIVVGQTWNVDSKDVVSFTTDLRMEGALTVS
jgi:hypothetical protein